MVNLNLIFPEIFIIFSIMFLLIFGVFKKNSENLVYNLSFVALLILLALIFNLKTLNQSYLFNESYKIDKLSTFMKILTVGSGLFIMISASKYLKITKILKIEYPVLFLSAILGMMVMISSNDLILFYLGLEIQAISLYVLTSFNRDNLFSTESGVKFFILSALSSGLLLYGCSLVYGFSGTTNFNLISSSNLSDAKYGITFGLVFILVGLAFKISAVPFHMWAPDVYQGSPTSVTFFFAILPKIAALTVLIRFLYVPFANMIDHWQLIIVFLSIASMTFGAVAAIGQKNIKRLAAYSSIGHMGYVLAGISVGSIEGIHSSIIYISIYVVMNIALFCCLFMLRRNEIYYENIDDLSGLSKNHPLLSFSLLIILFSLAGIPPLAGFFAKFYVFMAVIEKSMYLLAIVGLLSTVVAAFYYLRIIKIIYFDPKIEKYDTTHHAGLKLSLIVSTIFILLYFIFPGTIINIISKINII